MAKRPERVMSFCGQEVDAAEPGLFILLSRFVRAGGSVCAIVLDVERWPTDKVIKRLLENLATLLLLKNRNAHITFGIRRYRTQKNYQLRHLISHVSRVSTATTAEER